MLSLVYVSAAVQPWTTAELTALLEQSRANNAQLGITGMLLYKNHQFMQALEGPPAAVRALEARIARDPRHRDVLTLIETPIRQRAFGEWAMGFHQLDDEPPLMLPGYSNFLQSGFAELATLRQPQLVHKVLQHFRERGTG